MRAITRWEPFRDLLGMHNELTRLVDHGWLEENGGRAWAPAVDIYETADGYRAVCELAGFGPEEVDVTVDDGTLTVKGERKFYDEATEEGFRRVERRFGSFQRSISLPSHIDPAKIVASFDKGVLTVELPTAEEAKPRRIKIGVTGS